MENETPAQNPQDLRLLLLDYIRHPEFKRLLNQILTAQNTSGFKSAAVISQFAGEGRTFFISVMALGYATFLGKRVLIMDTISQTRNESLYLGRVLNQENPEDAQSEATRARSAGARGAIDLITTRNLSKQLQLYSEMAPGAQFDPTTPVTQLETQSYESTDFKIGTFIRTVAHNYDLILLDTCALSEATKNHFDPVILAKQADTAILITSDRSLERDILADIKEEIARCKLDILGSVYNSGVIP